MAAPATNPYRYDETDQAHCAVCGKAISQPRRGPARVYCGSGCRRAGAERHRLAAAWDEGYAVGRSGRSVAPAPAPPDRRHWATAFQDGAEAAKRHARDRLADLESAIDFQLRRPSPEHRAGLKEALAAMRESLRLGTRTG